MNQTKVRKIVYHACYRCNGDIFLDEENREYVCLQCGRTTPLSMRVQSGPALISSPVTDPRQLVGANKETREENVAA